MTRPGPRSEPGPGPRQAPGRRALIAGVDLGQKGLHVALVGRGGSAVGSFMLERPQPDSPHGPADAARVAAALRRRRLPVRRVALVAPRRTVRAEVVAIPPPGSGAPIDAIVRAEAARLFNLEPDAFECVWSPIEGAQRQPRASIIAAAHDDLLPICDAFDAQGLPPAVVLAPARAAALAIAARPEPVIVLDLGWGPASIYALRGGATLFQRTLPDISIRGLVGDLASATGVDHEAARHAAFDGRDAVPALVGPGLRAFAQRLAAELTKSVDYVAGFVFDARPDRVWAIGGAAADQELGDVITAHAGLCVESPPIAPPTYAAAAGAALSIAATRAGRQTPDRLIRTLLRRAAA